MKKCFWCIVVSVMALLGCVKDENPFPEPPAPTPEKYSDIRINELIAKDVTNPYYIDSSGSPTDWLELYNTGTTAVNVAGMWITDTKTDTSSWQQIPTGYASITTIPPHGFMVLICGATDAGGNDLPTQILDGHVFIDMGISSSKDSIIVLYDPEGLEVDRSANFGVDSPHGELPDDRSTGPLNDGGPDSEWIILTVKTPGDRNDGTLPVTGKLVVNEFMSSNDNFPVPGVTGDFPDWIEIYNTGEVPIDMGGWYCTDNLSDMVQYQIPAGNPGLTTVPPHGFLLLICDGTGNGLHTNFKLSGSGESIGFSKDGATFEVEINYGDGLQVPNPPTDNSAGYDVNGGNTWMIFTPGTSHPPTPGSGNN